MFKRILTALGFIGALVTTQAAKAETIYDSVFPTAASIKCASNQICANLGHVRVQSITFNSMSGSGLYKWESTCDGTPDSVTYIQPSGTTGCLAMEGFVYTGPIMVSNTDGIKALVPTDVTSAIRQGFASAGDGAPPLTYNWTPSSCTTNAGNGDNGSEIKSNYTGCWLASFPSGRADVTEFGCVYGGTSDCYAAISSAITFAATSPSYAVVFSGIARSSQALSFGSVRALGAFPISPTTPTQIGSPEIQCDITVVATCATFGISGAGNAGGSVQDLLVSFASGTPVSGQTAIRFQGNNSHCSDVGVHDAYVGYEFLNGITVHCVLMYSWRIQYQHIVQNGFPEIYITSGRFGLNASGEPTASDSFFGITGNDPNTLICTDCQFNLSSQSTAHLMNFYNISSQINGIYYISDSVFDNLAGTPCSSVFKTDSTAYLLHVHVVNSWINAGCKLIDQSAQKQAPVDFQLVNNSVLKFSDTTIDTGGVGQNIVFDISHNNSINGNLTLNSGAGSGSGGHGIFNNNGMQGNLTLTSTGHAWLRLDALGNHFCNSCTFTDSATGNIYANTPNVAWTPVLNFGGAASDWTYTSSGYSHRNADGTFTAVFGVHVTGKGTTTGAVTITGNPYTCATNYNLGGGFGNAGPSTLYAHALTGLTGAVTGELNQNATSISLAQSSSTGYSYSVADTNFSASPNSFISGQLTCPAK